LDNLPNAPNLSRKGIGEMLQRRHRPGACGTDGPGNPP
jgi:hypothetical protein